MKWEEPYFSGSGTGHKKDVNFSNYESYYLRTLKILKGAEKLQPKLCEVTGGTKTKIYCKGTISEMRPCSAMDCQIGCE
jgi:hypothetical protein